MFSAILSGHLQFGDNSKRRSGSSRLGCYTRDVDQVDEQTENTVTVTWQLTEHVVMITVFKMSDEQPSDNTALKVLTYIFMASLLLD